VWAASIGIAPPFGICAVQTLVASLHQLPARQSASTSQPPIGSQVPSTLHEPERQTIGPVATVHGPSAAFKPQSLSVSQTPETQTAVATAGEHAPVSAGVWPLTVGIAAPFTIWGTQVKMAVLHHCPLGQSESAPHPPTGMHVPLALSHTPLAQSPFTLQAEPLADVIALYTPAELFAAFGSLAPAGTTMDAESASCADPVPETTELETV
jgi:hypothetical protein